MKRIEATQGHGKGEEAEAYLSLSEEQLALRRRDGRPVVGPHVVPQRQVTQIPEEDVMEVCLAFLFVLFSAFHLIFRNMSERWSADSGVVACRNSAPGSSPSVCAITISSRSSSPCWRDIPRPCCWQTTSPSRIWRRRCMAKLRTSISKGIIQSTPYWRQRIVSLVSTLLSVSFILTFHPRQENHRCGLGPAAWILRHLCHDISQFRDAARSPCRVYIDLRATHGGRDRGCDGDGRSECEIHVWTRRCALTDGPGDECCVLAWQAGCWIHADV